MVENNPQLIHLFLNNCNLSTNILKEVLPAFKRSRSLVAIHLANNTGISEETKPELAKLLDIEILQESSINYNFQVIDAGQVRPTMK
jgi:hypothetical protein